MGVEGENQCSRKRGLCVGLAPRAFLSSQTDEDTTMKSPACPSRNPFIKKMLLHLQEF